MARFGIGIGNGIGIDGNAYAGFQPADSGFPVRNTLRVPHSLQVCTVSLKPLR